MAHDRSRWLPATDGRKVHLVGQQVQQIRFSYGGAAVRLTFCDELDQPSEIAIHGAIRLSRGSDERLLNGAKAGKEYNPRELSPLVDLLGSRVEGVWSEKGEDQARILALGFSNH